LYRFISSDIPRQMMVDRGARRRERTRTSLLEGARRVIADKGFDAATISEITQAADVGFGSFYNHFQSKDELLGVLVTAAVDAHGRAIDSLMANESDPARLVAAMQADKKTRAGRLRFVLPERIGKVRCGAEVAPDALLHVLQECASEQSVAQFRTPGRRK